jgi:hypothetical protein
VGIPWHILDVDSFVPGVFASLGFVTSGGVGTWHCRCCSAGKHNGDELNTKKGKGGVPWIVFPSAAGAVGFESDRGV